MIKPLIEFCVSNLANGSQQARAVLEKDPNLDIIEYGCLGYCGVCYEGPYVLINGDIVTGSTPDELITNIYEYLEENPMF